MLCGMSTEICKKCYVEEEGDVDKEQYGMVGWVRVDPLEREIGVYDLACSRSTVLLYEIRISVFGNEARRSTAFASVAPQ